MEQTFKNVRWDSYLLFVLAIWAFGFLAVALLPLMLQSARSAEKRHLRTIFNLFAVVMISYGVGKDIALYENANEGVCTTTIECLKFRITGSL